MRRLRLVLLLVAPLLLAACSDDGAAPTPTTATTATAPPVTTATVGDEPETTTTAPEVETALALRGDGLGVAAFGEQPDPVVAAVTGVLGDPTKDTGWGDAATSSYGTCPADRIRGVEWDGLALLFVDGDGGQTFAGWHLSGAPPALATAAGFGFGATADDAHDLYGQDVELVPAEDPYPAYLRVDVDGGPVTAFLGDDDQVTNLEAGIGCGE